MPASLPPQQWHAMLDELIEGYKTDDFQRRLHAGWYATTNNVERLKVRQKLCFEVQAPIISKFGFEASRKGVAQSVVVWRNDPKCVSDEQLNHKMGVVSWLVDPDIQALEPRGPSGMMNSFSMQYDVAAHRSVESEVAAPMCEYKVCITDAEDDAAVKGVATCQGTIAGAHQALYKHIFPDLDGHDWFTVLGCRENIPDTLDFGTVIIHAEVVGTGQVVGYIAVTRDFGDTGGTGANATLAEDSSGFTQINHIVVLPEHRKRGLGKRLFAELLDFLQATSPRLASDLRLSVVELNQEAREWYRRLGFIEVEEDEAIAYPGNCPVKFIAMRRVGGDPRVAVGGDAPVVADGGGVEPG